MGLMGAAVTTLLFGFSKSFAFALTMRALAGGLSGNAPVLQSVVGDITDKTNEVKAYSILAGGWSLAQISGPYVGYVVLDLKPRVALRISQRYIRSPGVRVSEHFRQD